MTKHVLKSRLITLPGKMHGVQKNMQQLRTGSLCSTLRPRSQGSARTGTPIRLKTKFLKNYAMSTKTARGVNTRSHCNQKRTWLP